MRPEKADTEYALEAIELRKRYGDVVALDGATLYVKRGVLMALVGPNGAGKTTLIEGVLGLRRLDGGKVVLLGREVKDELPRDVAKRLGLVLEGSSMFDELSLVDNLRLAASIVGFKPTLRQILNALDAVGIRELAARPYGKLSTGQRRRAEIAAAILTEPEFLILDEPEAGLDPAARVEMVKLLEGFAKRGMTVLFSTHDLTVASQAWEVAVIVKGKVVAHGDPADIAAKHGGRWRIRAVLKDGRAEELEAQSPSELPQILQKLGEVKSLHVEPPTLLEAFKKLAGYE